MKKIVSILFILLMFIALSLVLKNEKKDLAYKVAISKMVDHPALDQTVKGIIDELHDQGYSADKNMTLNIQSAQGQSVLAQHIASSFAHQNYNVWVGVGTVAAQSFLPYLNDGLGNLVYSSVTDPSSAGLIQESNGCVTGVSNFIPLEQQIELFLLLQPKLKKLGMLYNSGELNSVTIIEKMKTVCPSYGIDLIVQGLSKTSDISSYAEQILDQVDALFISNDNTLLSCLPTILSRAHETSKPVYVSDTDAVSLGALAALGPDQYEIGRQTGKLVVKMLEATLGDLSSVVYPEKITCCINTRIAQQLGIIIPDDIKNRYQTVRLLGESDE